MRAAKVSVTASVLGADRSAVDAAAPEPAAAPLYIRHRPNVLEDMLGNETTVLALRTMMDRAAAGSGAPRAILFTGPSGCGKTTLARIVAAELGAHPRDVVEMDSADFRGIDTIRDVRRSMAYRPAAGPRRVWIMDEVHQLSKDAQSALLKALEDTPAHVTFLLATTDPEKLLPTIRNRCSAYEVAALTPNEVHQLLERAAAAEQAQLDPEALRLIVDTCGGSARAALVAAEKVMWMPLESQQAAAAIAIEEQEEAIGVARLLWKGAPWKAVAESIRNLTTEPETTRRVVLGYMSSVLLGGRDAQRAWLIMDAFRVPLYDTGRPGLVMAAYAACVAVGGRG